MSDPDKKSYRIWLNPEAPAKIENVRTQDFEEFSLKVWDYETEGWLYLPEEESKAIETQWISINPLTLVLIFLKPLITLNFFGLIKGIF